MCHLKYKPELNEKFRLLLNVKIKNAERIYFFNFKTIKRLLKKTIAR